MNVAKVLEPFDGRELIGLPELGDRLGETLGVGMSRTVREYAVRHGVIIPVPQRGPNGRYQLTPDEATRVVLAAMVAAAAGIAIVTALRGLQGLPSAALTAAIRAAAALAAAP